MYEEPEGNAPGGGVMKTVRFGIVGTGMIADFHAKAVASLEGVELAGVFSRNSEKALDFASRHGTKAVSSLEALLGDPQIDAICVTTPSGTHGEIAIAALNAGKHVLCEKPLEVTREKVDAMIAAAQRNNRHLAAVFQMRFNDGAVQMKKAFEAGRFGKVALCSCYIKWWRSQEYYDNGGWRGTKQLDGGGVLFNQGIHTLDLLQWIAGMPKTVQARIATLAHERIEVEDTAVALLEYPSGALGIIEASTAASPGFPSRIEISGDRGSAVLEGDRLVKWTFAEEAPEDVVIRERAKQGEFGSGASDPKAISIEGHRRQIEDLADSIRHNRSPAVPGSEARNAVHLVLGLYESARTGKPVVL